MPAPAWRRRLYESRWLLAAAVLVLVFFAGSGVGLAQIGMAALIFLAAALLLPGAGAASRPAEANRDAAPIAQRLAATHLVDALFDPCILIDSRAVVQHRNPPAAQQFPSLQPGNPIAFSMRQPILLAAIDRVRKSGVPESIELHQSVPRENWYRVEIAPFSLDNGPGDHRWLAVVLHNLSDQKRIEAIRADFVANASHELRTPLTSLLGFIETLKGPAAKDEAAREKFLDIMHGQATRMSKLINDLLSLSRIEQRLHLRPSDTVSLVSVVQEVIESLQTQANAANVKIKVDFDLSEAGRAEVTGDREELFEVFENLIENAVKYGGEGETVEVKLAATQRSGYAYQVTITDHGPGIAEEHVPRLTERFYRVDAESSRKKKGTGLGLAIVKHILNRHGGQMSIRSKLGEGTTVELLFAE